MYLRWLLILLVACLMADASELKCSTTQEGIKKIKCKYMDVTRNFDRHIVFNWVSPDNAADNRTKRLLLPAYNKSVFDFRYFGGRSEGLWKISATEVERNITISTEYLKDSNAEVSSEKPNDPILTDPDAADPY